KNINVASPQIVSFEINNTTLPITQSNLLSYEVNNKNYPNLNIEEGNDINEFSFSFNTPLIKESFEKSISISSKNGNNTFDSLHNNITFSWNQDNNKVKVILKEKLNFETNYKIIFNTPFENVNSQKSSIGNYIKFTNSFSNDFFAFYLNKKDSAKIKGHVFDIKGLPLENVLVKVISEGKQIESFTKSDGSYEFKSFDINSKVEVIISKNGWTEKKQIKVLSKGDNIINFEKNYSLQDEPEIIKLSINDKIANFLGFYDEKQIELKSLSNIFYDDKLKIKVLFSESINTNSFEDSFVLNEVKTNNDFVSIKGSENINFLWNSTKTEVIVTFNKSLFLDNDLNEKEYLLTFSKSFQDLKGMNSISGKHIKYSYYDKCSTNRFYLSKVRTISGSY
ncbi:MAG: hypothetical protein ACK4IX_11095, partial [Candidatus Sericytochromatia bacterium]